MRQSNTKARKGKARRTFSLSQDSVEFLELLRKRREASSSSAVLESLIADAKRNLEREKLDAEVAAYYSSLSEAGTHEQAEWGAFADSQFPIE
jgi:hypothetical protein